MIDLVRKIQGEKLVIPKHKQYRSSRPLFSRSTINIFRCVIDNPEITVKEIMKKTGASQAHIAYSLNNFCDNEIMSRIGHKIYSGIEYTYSISGSKISARELADSEEARLNTPNLTGRLEDIINFLKSFGQCTADKLAESLGRNNQNTRDNIRKLVSLGLVRRVSSNAKGYRFEYLLSEVAA